MKRFSWVLILIVGASPAWCAKKITVAQLEEMLRSFQQEKKGDVEVATALKQVELSQELTTSAMNSLVSYVPGPQSTEQVYVLEARSADLIPPESDLPSTPVPDAQGQKSILDRAAVYVTKTYEDLPSLSAVKTTLRFQDNVEAIAASSGLQNGAQDGASSPRFTNPATFVHYINSSETPVSIEHGAEKAPAEKDRTPWGANAMIALEGPTPSLGLVFREAQDAATLRWLRWQLVNGKPAAVYSFEVPRKKSRLDVAVCCFPSVTQAGVATFYTAVTAATLGDGASGGGVTGNFQTNTEWHNFKSTVPYRGEFFIDPETGIVVRMITESEFKPSEVVHQLDIRIDYAPVKVGAQVIVVPVKTFINTIVVPYGDSGAHTYTTRCTLFTSEYRDYQAGSRD